MIHSVPQANVRFKARRKLENLKEYQKGLSLKPSVSILVLLRLVSHRQENRKRTSLCQEQHNPRQLLLRFTENDRVTDKLEKPKTEEHEHRLRNILMTVQCDKEELEIKVESMSEELQRTKARLQNYERLSESIRDEADRNVKEMVEMKKVLEVNCERTERTHSLINKDILDLSEVSKSNEEQVRKLEQILGQYEGENTELQRQVETLKEKVEDEVTVKDAALEEGRQLRVSMKNVLQSKEKCLSLSEPPLLINNLNTDITLPQMGKEEVRVILKEILQDIEYSCSEEVTRLKQRLAEQTEELKMIRKEKRFPPELGGCWAT